MTDDERRAYDRRWYAANLDRYADYRRRAVEREARLSESEIAEKRARDKAAWTRCNAKRAAARTPLPVRACDTCGKLYQPDRISGRFCAEKCKRIAYRYLEARQCERCGKEYRPNSSNPKQRFCSNRCHYDARVPTLQPRTCVACGHTFQPRRAVQVTCCHTCGYAMRRERTEEVNRRPCAECGALFVPRQHAVSYCSRACAGLVKRRLYDRKITVNCEVCGKSFQAKRSRTSVKFCSNKCRGATPLHPFKVHVAKANAAREFLLSVGLYPKGPLTTASLRRNAALTYASQRGLLQSGRR